MFAKQTTLLTMAVVTACLPALAAGAAIPVAGTVGDVPFPDRERSYLSSGDFVNVDDLRQIRPGLSKDQVRLRLGNPHFSEGIAGVRTWNYVFNFHTGQGEAHITCQYQVRYGKQDSGYRVESMHWNDGACMELANREPDAARWGAVSVTGEDARREQERARWGTVSISGDDPQPAQERARWGTITITGEDILCGRERAPWSGGSGKAAQCDTQTVQGAVSGQGVQRFDFSADALFRFGRSGPDDILPGGREKLVAVASQLSQSPAQKITVVGHTDLIGTDAANQALSERRAETIRQYLAQHGARGEMVALGRGEREQTKQCDGPYSEDLVACLAPNRRVELIVEGAQ